MHRVALTDRETAFIRERVDRFESEAPDDWKWELPYVLKYGALPVFRGWTETLAIREDGSLVRWSTEAEWPGAREFGERTWVNLALVQAARLYPELQGLVPPRPNDADTCPQCRGSGQIAGLKEALKSVICGCGGTGWLPAESE
jgi:hypothetical protein